VAEGPLGGTLPHFSRRLEDRHRRYHVAPTAGGRRCGVPRRAKYLNLKLSMPLNPQSLYCEQLGGGPRVQWVEVVTVVWDFELSAAFPMQPPTLGGHFVPNYSA